MKRNDSTVLLGEHRHDFEIHFFMKIQEEENTRTDATKFINYHVIMCVREFV
jgi:hypothetical protein